MLLCSGLWLGFWHYSVLSLFLLLHSPVCLLTSVSSSFTYLWDLKLAFIFHLSLSHTHTHTPKCLSCEFSCLTSKFFRIICPLTLHCRRAEYRSSWYMILSRSSGLHDTLLSYPWCGCCCNSKEYLYLLVSLKDSDFF
jgi:hypothetical protein